MDLDKAIELLKDEVAYRESASEGSYHKDITEAMKLVSNFAGFALLIMPDDTLDKYQNATQEEPARHERKSEVVNFRPILPLMTAKQAKKTQAANLKEWDYGLEGALLEEVVDLFDLPDAVRAEIDSFLPSNVFTTANRVNTARGIGFVSEVYFYDNGAMNILVQINGYPVPTQFIRVR